MSRKVTSFSVRFGTSPELWRFLLASVLFTAAFGGFAWFMDEVLGIG